MDQRLPVSGMGLLAELQDFHQFGTRTKIWQDDEIRYFQNEFWTSAQRAAHSLHEVSYRACFKAQLPEFFISRLTRPGDVVHDPFMGRGTTPVQAGLMGRRAFGNDINPLSTFLARPRMAHVDIDDLESALARIDFKDAGPGWRDDLLTFYHPETLRQILALRSWIAAHEGDFHADWVRMLALTRLSGHSPGFFSGRSMPPNQAVSIRAQEKINARLGLEPPARDVAGLIMRKAKTLLKDGAMAPGVDFRFGVGEAWDSPWIEKESVDLVVTSPPFLDIVQYAEDNWLRCWFAGIDPKAVSIGMHRGEAGWQEMIRKTLWEMARILRPGGYLALEVGEVRRGKILLEKLVWEAARGLPFRRLGVMINSQKFTKTANLWGIENGKAGTNSNRIVILLRD